MVVSDDVDPAHLPGMPFRIHVVKQQWFGDSIQIDACADEQLYQAKVRGGRGREGEIEGGESENTMEALINTNIIFLVCTGLGFG